MVARAQKLPFGATLTPSGTHFRLWAPAARRVELRLGDDRRGVPLRRDEAGWHALEVEGLGAGALYRFAIDDDLAVPDPASRFQPFDVHGPSEVIDPGAFDWDDADWGGRPWREAVISEIHVGAFTPAGAFAAAIGELDRLKAIGVTAIELMPLADFSGSRNWGYDGVLPFAPDSSYGRPEDLKRLIAAAHRRGLMVLVDVVYNHFGPD